MSIINDVLVNKLFKDPPKRTKEIPLLSEKTASGDGMIVINDAYQDFPIKNLTLQGNTKQDSTMGAQLFDANKMNGLTKSGVTISVKDGVITAKGIAEKDEWIQAYVTIDDYKKLFKPGERVFIKSYKTTDCNYSFGLYGGHGNPILGTVTEGNSQTSGVLLPDEYPRTDTTFYFFLDVRKGVTLKGSLQPIVYQTGDGIYETYTGGKPSPSPEYPQEIKNVGKWNEEKQKYEVDVKVTGKNLIDTKNLKPVVGNATEIKYENNVLRINLMNEKTQCYALFDNDIRLYAGRTYMISSKILSKSRQDLVVKPAFFKTTGYGDLITLTKDYTPTDNIDINIAFYVESVTPFENDFVELTDFMIEISDSPTDYEPYKEPQILTLSTPNDIPGIPVKSDGNYTDETGQQWICDEIDLERGKYIQRIWKKTFDGSEDWELYLTERYEGFYLKALPEIMDNRKMYCNIYQMYNDGSGVRKEGILLGANNYNIYSAMNRFYNSSLEDKGLANWKAFLAQNPMEIVTYITTPMEIDLPPEIIEAYKKLYTYYPTTVITVDGGELPVGIEVTYMHPEYIPTKQSALRMWFKENPII